MTDARRTVTLRVAILVGFVGLLLWFFLWRPGQVWQYEVIDEGVLYRCSARTGEEFAAAAMKVYPQGLIVAGTSEQLASEALTAATNYGHKNRTRAANFTVEAGQPPSDDQLRRFLDYTANPRRQPVLIADADGRPTRMLAAAYRLATMKMPLEEVEKLAAGEGADPEIVAQVRQFARDCAAKLARPASAPAQPAATTAPAEPALPVGPAIPN